MPKTDYDYQQSDYTVSKEKESKNKPFEITKAVKDAEDSMAIKQERGGKVTGKRKRYI